MDIFDVLDANKRIRAEHLLEDLNNAVMSHTTDEKGFRKYTETLQQQASGAERKKTAQFDEGGFELMRMKLKGGAI
ncbi:hypothetical protein ACFQ3Y_09035 [Paenibacillus motobuensis]|uniref:hypothetical protein n=1 Tax=Paenibacillus motobuensis TaxID=295324 RepID=UPI003640A901